MKLDIGKALQPTIAPFANSVAVMDLYGYRGYKIDNAGLVSPSEDAPLDWVMDISRSGIVVSKYEIFFEIPDANIDDPIPSEVSFSGDVATWADLTLRNQGDTMSMRYYQPSNNGIFNVNDIEVCGMAVYGTGEMQLKVNTDEYSDIGSPDYVVMETIEYVDKNWRYKYFDMVTAYITITDLYEAKGGDDNARWAACTDIEKEIIVRWNIVGLTKASSIAPPEWGEARSAKEIGKKYRVFNRNMLIALERRFTDWYQYLNMILSGTGATKFLADWLWSLKDAYSHRYLRQYELGDVNSLVDFNDTTLGAYTDADFVGGIPAITIVTNLNDVLTAKTYVI